MSVAARLRLAVAAVASMSGLKGSVLGGRARGGAEARLVAQKKCYGRKGKGPVAYKQAKGIGGGKAIMLEYFYFEISGGGGLLFLSWDQVVFASII